MPSLAGKSRILSVEKDTNDTGNKCGAPKLTLEAEELHCNAGAVALARNQDGGRLATD